MVNLFPGGFRAARFLYGLTNFWQSQNLPSTFSAHAVLVQHQCSVESASAQRCQCWQKYSLCSTQTPRLYFDSLQWRARTWPQATQGVGNGGVGSPRPTSSTVRFHDETAPVNGLTKPSQGHGHQKPFHKPHRQCREMQENHGHKPSGVGPC